MTPSVSRIQRLAGLLEDECRRRGVDLVPGQAGHVLRHQARVVAAALHISESWALRSYLGEDAMRGLAANLVREVNAARPVREMVLDVLAKVGGWARDDRLVRKCAHPQRPAEGPELVPALVADLRALASVAAQQMAWDLYTDAVHLGDQPYAYYADERDGVLLRLPRVCDGMDAAWRLRFAGILERHVTGAVQRNGSRVSRGRQPLGVLGEDRGDLVGVVAGERLPGVLVILWFRCDCDMFAKVEGRERRGWRVSDVTVPGCGGWSCVGTGSRRGGVRGGWGAGCPRRGAGCPRRAS